MLHLLDSDAEMAKLRANVDNLISEVCAPFALTGSIPGRSDNLAVYRALCILLPRDALETLRQHYRAGRLTRETIAKMAVIPVEWMEYLLSPAWEQVQEHLHTLDGGARTR
jgi:hypothetical protein